MERKKIDWSCSNTNKEVKNLQGKRTYQDIPHHTMPKHTAPHYASTYPITLCQYTTSYHARQNASHDTSTHCIESVKQHKMARIEGTSDPKTQHYNSRCKAARQSENFIPEIYATQLAEQEHGEQSIMWHRSLPSLTPSQHQKNLNQPKKPEGSSPKMDRLSLAVHAEISIKVA